MICSSPGFGSWPSPIEDAQAAGVKKGHVDAGDAVDDAGDANGVVRPAPSFAGDRDAARNGAVDVGEILGLDVAVGPAGAGEDAHSSP